MKFTDRFQVTVSKKPKTTPPPPSIATEPTPPVDYVQIIRESAEVVAKYAAIGVGGYILLDTFRQCAVKITPQN